MLKIFVHALTITNEQMNDNFIVTKFYLRTPSIQRLTSNFYKG